jgi:aerobic-type carbon monoxide dehydrogenase small subunit (CoxS/CutS family)
MVQTVKFVLNGKPVEVSADGERMLLWILRGDLGLTGTKFGCGEGFCGACTVLVDGAPMRSCQYPLAEVEGKNVLTIEGLSRDGRLHPLQEAFVKHDALQCGYCTPGMILTAYGLLLENPHPGEAEIRDALEGNICRCGAHVRIVAAVLEAAAAGEGVRREKQ